MADRIVVMNHGVIEQVGSPAEVYARPATAFVADFVGTMTFLDGTMAAERKVRIAGVDLTCASDSGMPAGTPIRLGFRPEEVQVRGVRPDTPNSLRAHVADLEYLGAFCRAMLELPAAPGVQLIADFSANAMRDLGIGMAQDILIALPPAALRVYPANAEVAA